MPYGNQDAIDDDHRETKAAANARRDEDADLCGLDHYGWKPLKPGASQEFRRISWRHHKRWLRRYRLYTLTPK